jgi:two-component system CheB/CheR fusion protein
LQRRVKRRLVLHHLSNIKEYLKFIKQNPRELEELYKDILIHVTGFFRDAAAFEALQQQVFPHLFQARKKSAEELPIRIWIPGCSTGEEVYSIAMVLLEYMWEHGRGSVAGTIAAKPIQIFATDISDAALDRARVGLYTESAMSEVSLERRKRFFVALDGGYQVNKPIREMCIFARQNVAKDPPFSNVDLISCRNLLIYLGPALQKRVIPTLHYALKPGGYLLLGGSESLGAFSDHFTLIDKKVRIYQKKHTSTRLITYFTGPEYSLRRTGAAQRPRDVQSTENIEKEVERALVNRYVPASIVVNDEMEIVQFRGRTGAYLEPATGHPTFSLSKMAREGLMIDLRAALGKARQENVVVRKEGVQVKSDGHLREVNLEVIPVRGQESNQQFYVVVFQDAGRDGDGGGKKTGASKRTARELPVARITERLNRELVQLREQLQSLIEEHDMTTEEFKTANEEVLSANEELQSTNEELETAKEELQSTNEELTTVNEELQNRNIELGTANSDLVNLLANVNIAVVMVGNDLRVRRFTAPAQKLMNLIAADRGRRLTEIRSNIEIEDIDRVVQSTIDKAILQEREVQDREGHWHMMRVRPYKAGDNKVDGAVISFQDIDVFKRSVDQSRALTDNLVENAREPILILDDELRVTTANRAFYRKFQVAPNDVENQMFYDLGDRQWNIPELRTLLEDIRGGTNRVDDFEVQQDFPRLGRRVMVLNARAVDIQSGRHSILLSIEDVTDKRKHMESLNRQAALFENVHEAIVVRDFSGKILGWNRGAEELYGWSEAEALGKSTHELLQTRFPAAFAAIKAELERYGHWQGELVHTTKQGESRTVDSRWALYIEGGTGIILEVNSDVTHRKHSEENLRQLSAHLLRVQDEERRRIARELHDSTGQKLVALQLSLSAVQNGAELKAKEKASLEDAMELAHETVSEIRTLSQLLHPPMLDEAGLGSAIRWLVDRISDRSGLRLDLEIPSEMSRLPEPVEIALFRVIQESLNNIHRHSGATKAKIRLSMNGASARLGVSDNGKGMSKKLLESGKDEKFAVGVGILGMKERLTQLGGSLEITSSKKGTTVTATVPLGK